MTKLDLGHLLVVTDCIIPFPSDPFAYAVTVEDWRGMESYLHRELHDWAWDRLTPMPEAVERSVCACLIKNMKKNVA